MHYNSGNLPNVQITEKISEYTERSVYVLSLRLSCTQDHAHKITLFKINTWVCVGGGGGEGGDSCLTLTRMLFVSLRGIKITLGCSEWKANVFTLGFMFWLKISYQCFQIYLPVALGYRNNEIDTIEGKK